MSLLCSFALGIAPLLAGLLFELVIVTPLRVPVNETPLFFVYQDWAMGIVALKVWSRFVAAGVFGDTTWKRNLEHINRQNLENLDVWFVLRGLLIPVVLLLTEALAVPYAFSSWIFPLFVKSSTWRMACFRFSFLTYSIFLLAQFFGGYIKNWNSSLRKQVFEDKYVVGKSLRNVDQ
jgi:E3 ubiquitin-protein ligase MARCH6